ncbi:unnamed protein product [Mytilus coruscus]|uniref:Reverse transcriptase zinc-binding domain-containing protein n=1 Tax=Mytilus coruscus TaxID=42192 RepID=A0A6J8ACT0_MYTCO|nr:unnamed protein product [Mytilus coruscus]
MNLDNQHSFFCKVAGTFTLYDLPSIDSLKQQPPSKLKWKSSVKLTFQDYWSKFFLKEIESKTTLVHLHRALLKIVSVHPVWTSLSSTISDVKKGAIKIRLLTGTYLFESNKHKFSGGKESSLCRCCGTSNEDITHFLLLCPALHQQRQETFSNLKALVISIIGTSGWTATFKNQSDIVKLIIDSTFLLPEINSRTNLDKIQKMSCFLFFLYFNP